MTTTAFHHVLDELKRLDFANLLALVASNEPFLHPCVVEFCRLVSEELPEAAACLITNGSLMRKEHLEVFAQLETPPRITVNDYTPGHKINERLRCWLSEPHLARIPVELKDRSWAETLSNRAGNQPGGDSTGRGYRSIACSWPFGALFINPELKAFLCCSDYSYETIVGDLSNQPLMEIWNGDPIRSVREALLVPDRTKVPLCAKCDAEWWCLPAHCLRPGDTVHDYQTFFGRLPGHSVIEQRS